MFRFVPFSETPASSSCARFWERSSAPMKKTLFYEFLPSKDDEDYLSAHSLPRRSRLIEIRDEDPIPKSISHSQPTLIKTIRPSDARRQELPFTHDEAFDYIFRYWYMSAVEHVLSGLPAQIMLRDDTEYSGQGRTSKILHRIFTYLVKYREGVDYYVNIALMMRSGRIREGDVVSVEFKWSTCPPRPYLSFKLIGGEGRRRR